MVPLPLFKIGALFVRHISKYGANTIKDRAHNHPQFRAFAARYGQKIHQLNMRLNVALLRKDAEQKAKEAKEKAEAPTVKTEDQIKKEEQVKAKYGTTAREAQQSRPAPTSIWKRHFRDLPEAKAVDLFADMIGDTFILMVAAALIIYEYYRSSTKPDHNAERIKEVEKKLDESNRKERELEERVEAAQTRVKTIEEALRAFKDPKTKQPLLPAPTASA